MTTAKLWTHGLYAIYDLQAESYVGGVHLHTADAAAIRMFGDIAVDPQTMIGKHPADYELRRLGDFHVQQGILGVDERTILTGEQWALINRPQTADVLP